METMVLALVVFALAFVGMAIGVIFAGKEKQLKGSCGGVGTNPDCNFECCMACPDKPACDDAHVHDDESARPHPSLQQAP